jgi:hypothetical protein
VGTIVATSLAGLALAVAAEPAAAVDMRTCRSHTAGSTAPGYERVGQEVRKAILPELRNHLGRQYTAYWLQPDDAGWYVGVAPGKRSLAQVRAYLRGPAVTWTGDEACTYSDAYRSEVTPYADSTQADVDKVKHLVARFGDRVRVVRVDHPLT